MNFANHIAFGLCTTNIGLAMSNATATNDATSITLCVISSLIPDIDQPQSLIGRITSPLSQFIYSNYGHRTLTHSLLFLLITTIPAFVLEFFLFSSTRYSLIFTIAISSHILLDMFTIEGVEFLFPFSKTQYVVFTDTRYSITGSNKKHQLIVFSSIVIFTIAILPFFKLGASKFLRSKMNTIRNIYEISCQSADPIYVKYDLVQNGKCLNGSGNVVKAEANSLIIFNNEFITIDSSTIINQLQPIKSTNPLEFSKKSIKGLNYCQLVELTKDKFLVVCSIQSNYNMLYHLNSKLIKTKNLFVEYVYSPMIEIEHNDDSQRIEILNNIKNLQSKISKCDIVEREIYTRDLIKLKKEIATLDHKDQPTFDVELTFLIPLKKKS